MTPHAPGRRRHVAFALTAGAVLWCLATFIPAAHPLFAPVCHQLPERSFAVAGVPLNVCARCTGLYLGFLIGAVAYGSLHRRLPERWAAPPGRGVLMAAAIPVLLEGGAEISGLWAGLPAARCLTGALFGTVVPFYFIPAADGMLAEARAELSRLILKWENTHAATRTR